MKMRLRRKDVELPNFPMGETVPRILHQHYFQGDEAIPDPIRPIRDALRAANPDWAYSFWDAELAERWIAETYGGEILARYLRISPDYYAARSDLLRYLNLYALGGVYLDIKSTCDRPLSKAVLPGDTYLLMHWDPGSRPHHPEIADVEAGEYVQFALASVRGHPILRDVILQVLSNIDSYTEMSFGTGYKGTLRVTGPIAYTLVVEKARARHQHSYVSAAGERGFIYSPLERDSHWHIYGKHYRYLKTPVVVPSPFEAAMLAGVRRFKRLPGGAALVRYLRAVLVRGGQR